jgi:hypothetical protein
MTEYTGEFYPKEMTWEFFMNEDSMFKYTIDDVVIPVVEYFAKKDEKIEGPVDELEPEKEAEILEWFEQKVFGTEEFGDQMITWIREFIKQMETEEDLTDLFTDQERHELTIEDTRLTIKEKEIVQEQEQLKEKVESYFKSLSDKDADAVFSGILNNELWVEPIMKKVGLDLYNQSMVEKVIYPTYYKIVANR